MTSISATIPTKLYKYQTFNQYSEENLKKRQIYFPTPADLNDPFDCAVPFKFTDSSNEELETVFRMFSDPLEDKKVISDQYLTDGKPDKRFGVDIDHLAKKVNNIQLNYFQKMGVACFSDSPSQNPDNILLWSHYAKGHKGFCLEFDTNFPPFQGSEIDIQEVKYETEYPSASSASAVIGGKIWINPLITKSNEWSYEHEWRLIVDKGSTFFNYDPKALTSVYFGCLMPNDDKEKIVQILKGSSTMCYEMIRSHTTYTVEIKK